MKINDIPHNPLAGISQLWKIQAIQFDRALDAHPSRTDANHTWHHPPLLIHVDEIDIPSQRGVKKQRLLVAFAPVVPGSPRAAVEEREPTTLAFGRPCFFVGAASVRSLRGKSEILPRKCEPVVAWVALAFRPLGLQLRAITVNVEKRLNLWTFRVPTFPI
jgi:hypothetical protein